MRDVLYEMARAVRTGPQSSGRGCRERAGQGPRGESRLGPRGPGGALAPSSVGRRHRCHGHGGGGLGAGPELLRVPRAGSEVEVPRVRCGPVRSRIALVEHSRRAWRFRRGRGTWPWSLCGSGASGFAAAAPEARRGARPRWLQRGSWAWSCSRGWSGAVPERPGRGGGGARAAMGERRFATGPAALAPPWPARGRAVRAPRGWWGGCCPRTS